MGRVPPRRGDGPTRCDPGASGSVRVSAHAGDDRSHKCRRAGPLHLVHEREIPLGSATPLSARAKGARRAGADIATPDWLLASDRRPPASSSKSLLSGSDYWRTTAMTFGSICVRPAVDPFLSVSNEEAIKKLKIRFPKAVTQGGSLKQIFFYRVTSQNRCDIYSDAELATGEVSGLYGAHWR